VELIFNKNCSASELTTLDLTALLKRGNETPSLSQYVELFKFHFENGLGDSNLSSARNFHYLKMFYYTFFDHGAYISGEICDTEDFTDQNQVSNDCAGHLRSWGLMSGADGSDDDEEPYEDTKRQNLNPDEEVFDSSP